MRKVINAFLKKFDYELLRSNARRMQGAMPVELNQDEREIIKYIMAKQLTMVSYPNLWATVMSCKHVISQNISGDFVECGVWRGGNALAAAEIFKLYKSDRKVWLFDTFKGMTAPSDLDVRISNNSSPQYQYTKNQKRFHNEWCYASLEDVQRNFEHRGVFSNINYVEGDVCETLDQTSAQSIKNISVLRLDTDWYQSTKKELEVLYPKLVVGGFLIIDDYGTWSGSRKATDEYFENQPKRPFLHYIDQTGRLAIKM